MYRKLKAVFEFILKNDVVSRLSGRRFGRESVTASHHHRPYHHIAVAGIINKEPRTIVPIRGRTLDSVTLECSAISASPLYP